MSARVQHGQENGRGEDGETESRASAQAKGNDLSLSREKAGKRKEVPNGVVDRPDDCEGYSTD